MTRNLLHFMPAAGLRALRADRILGGAIAAVAIMVTLLFSVMTSENTLHNRTVQTIVTARAARDEMQALTGNLADVELARRAMLLREPDASRRLAEAAASARGHVSKLREIGGADSTLSMLVSHLENVVEQDFAMPATARVAATAQTRTDLRTALDYLRVEYNVRNDAARERERAYRERLTWMTTALAFLALATSALAFVVLRREREQWRLARDAAAEAHAKAAASDLAKTRFLATASHDMRQPLHALTLYLSALSKRVEGEEARSILAKAERATRSMVAMFSTLLDLARIQAGIVTPEKSDFRLQEVFEHIAAENPGAALAITPTPLVLRSDPVLIERILRNLVANALKHGGGSARLEAQDNGAQACITVRDEGPGIAAADQQRIFDEFVRVQGAGAAREGLGLGLSVVKHIADMLDLRLKLDSAPGQGAAFMIHAPIVGRSAAAAPAGATAPARLDGVDALVVDDDTLAREALGGALEDMGASVRACANESEVERLIAQGYHPRLIVTDLRIDGRFSGIALARTLRARFGRSAAAIVVTGDTETDTLEELRASGLPWLVKPVAPDELAQTAQRALELSPI